MKLISVKKTSNNYKAVFDDGSTLCLSEEVIIKYGLLRHNIEINNIAQIIKDNDYYIALNAAYRYLYNVHSKREVYEHLIKKYDKDIVLQVIDKLEQMNLIDDLEYARLLYNHFVKVLKGKELYLYTLKEEGIKEEVILQASSFYLEKDEIEVCQKAIDKILINYKKYSNKEKIRKLKAYLLSRGFSENIVNILLAKEIEMLDNIDNESKALSYQYERCLKKYQNKYEGYELKEKIIHYLLQKGFKYDSIKEMLQDD